VLAAPNAAVGGSDGVVVVERRPDGSATVSLAEVADVVPGALDPGRPLVRAAEPRTAVGVLDREAADRLRAFWLLAVAADCLGTAGAAFEAALTQARERSAFGRPIGAFQAVRHRCADLYVDLETTRATVTEGGLAWSAAAPDALLLALVAAAHALDAVVRVTEGAVLLHGAMGFTREAAPQALLRRAYAMRGLATDVRVLRRELATG
jgi:alkylation response protein AidB-like acyl-CoA dehydrogenase